MPLKEITAIVGTDHALVRIEEFGAQRELVVEDDTDRCVVHLTPGIAREIIEKLSAYLLSVDREPSDAELAAAFRDVYAHIGVRP